MKTVSVMNMKTSTKWSTRNQRNAHDGNGKITSKCTEGVGINDYEPEPNIFIQ